MFVNWRPILSFPFQVLCARGMLREDEIWEPEPDPEVSWAEGVDCGLLLSSLGG